MTKQHTEELPAQQRNYGVGYGKPPKKHQPRPDQPGNPAGSPKPRTNLYRHFSKYAALTDAELTELDLGRYFGSLIPADAELTLNLGAGRFVRVGEHNDKIMSGPTGTSHGLTC